MSRSLIKMLKSLSAEPVHKAIDDQSLRRVNRASDPSFNSVVDDAGHSTATPDSKYVEAVLSPKKMTKVSLRAGISAKAVHKVGDNTFMIKPYHKKIESHTRTWVKSPITGWATIATKNLMHAAGMANNTEDVSYYNHNGTPLTVHKFAPPTYGSPVFSGGDNEVEEPLAHQAHKIAIMDFLSGNGDRHFGNLLFDRDARHLIAIDHERNFQYHKPLSKTGFGDAFENPIGYLGGSALRSFAGRVDGYSDPGMIDELSEWWHNHKDGMRNSLVNDLNHIKDPHIKDHILQNFTRRFDAVDDFMSHDPISIFTHSFPEVELYKKQLPRQTVRATLNSLPSDPEEAVGKIDKMLSKKRSSASAASLIKVWKGVVSKMSPDAIVRYYNSGPHHNLDNHSSGAVYGMLLHISETKNKAAMEALLNKANLPPFWLDRFREEISQ